MQIPFDQLEEKDYFEQSSWHQEVYGFTQPLMVLEKSVEANGRCLIVFIDGDDRLGYLRTSSPSGEAYLVTKL